MAFTFNGIGTTLYGRCAFRADGTFQTTKWFVFGNFPIAPLKTYRVARDPGNDVTAVVYDREGYQMLEELPLDAAQVLRTYAFALLYVAWVILLSWLLVEKAELSKTGTAVFWSLVAGYALALGVPFMLLSWRRKVALQLVCSAAQN